MRFYHLLSEETVDDLHRKIAAMNAMINDRASTDGEKENARSLKKKLELRLQTEFPNQQPSWISDMSNDWFGQMAKAAAAEKEREDLFAKDPKAKEDYFRGLLNNLRARRKQFLQNRIPGDVESSGILKDYNRRIDKILKQHFPSEWQELLKKREEQRRAGYKRSAEKSKLKKKEQDNLVKQVKIKDNLGTWKEIGKEYEDVLRKFQDKIKDLRIPQYPSQTFGKFKSGASTLSYLNWVSIGDIRNKWSELDPADQEKIKEAISKVHTLGPKSNGYTDAQKKRIIDAMRPSKAAPSKYPPNTDKYQEKLKRKAERRKSRFGW